MPWFPEMRDSYKDFSRINGVLGMSILRAKIAPLPVSGDNSLLCVLKIPAILEPDGTISVTQAYCTTVYIRRFTSSPPAGEWRS